MIVTSGKFIRIEAGHRGGYRFERNAESPGLVRLTNVGHTLSSEAQMMSLPGNLEDAKALIAAYWRIVQEDVGYRSHECESDAEPLKEVLEEALR